MEHGTRIGVFDLRPPVSPEGGVRPLGTGAQFFQCGVYDMFGVGFIREYGGYAAENAVRIALGP